MLYCFEYFQLFLQTQLLIYVKILWVSEESFFPEGKSTVQGATCLPGSQRGAVCSVQCAVRSSKYQVASTVRVLVRWGPLRSVSRIVSPIGVITVVGGAHRAVWSVSWSVSGYDTFSSVSLILELPAPSWLPCASILLSSLFFSVLLCSSAFFSVPRRNKWENDSTPGVLEQSNPRGNQFSLALSLPRH